MLYRAVQRVIVLDRGGRFHLDESDLTGIVALEYVASNQDAFVSEGRLEYRDWIRGLENRLSLFQGLAQLGVMLDQDAVGPQGACRRTHLVPGIEQGLGLR